MEAGQPAYVESKKENKKIARGFEAGQPANVKSKKYFIAMAMGYHQSVKSIPFSSNRLLKSSMRLSSSSLRLSIDICTAL